MKQAEAGDIDIFGHVSYHYAVGCDGIVYEALDIREKGAHVEKANTGKIGIVLLADFSMPGEAESHGPGMREAAKKGFVGLVREKLGQAKDIVDMSWDTPHAMQLKAVDVLVKTLMEYFNIERLGGHREFAILNDVHRACPGAHGMKIARDLRDRYGLAAPQ